MDSNWHTSARQIQTQLNNYKILVLQEIKQNGLILLTGCRIIVIQWKTVTPSSFEHWMELMSGKARYEKLHPDFQEDKTHS